MLYKSTLFVVLIFIHHYTVKKVTNWLHLVTNWLHFKGGFYGES